MVLEEGLTSVARSAFRGCTDLARVEFPQSLTSVYYYAFADSGLTEAILPDSVTRLWPGAFENCVSLERVEFPSELQDIAEAVFLGGVSLTEADLSAVLLSAGSPTRLLKTVRPFRRSCYLKIWIRWGTGLSGTARC